MSSNIDVVMKNFNQATLHVYLCHFLHGIAQIPVGKAQNELKQLRSHWKKLKTELKVSSNTDVVMESTNQGTHMFMKVFCAWDSSNSNGESSKSRSK